MEILPSQKVLLPLHCAEITAFELQNLAADCVFIAAIVPARLGFARVNERPTDI